MEKKDCLVKYFWQVTYAHTIAWFIAGVFASKVLNYETLYLSDIASSFMRPVNEPIVALGLSLQIFRGIIIGFVILPLRKVFFEEKHGFLKLAGILVGLSLISTFGPTWGSFDGYIFTKLPVMYHIIAYPEAIIYFTLFVGILFVSMKYQHKKIITILSIIFVLLIVLMSLMGYMSAKGYLSHRGNYRNDGSITRKRQEI
jgi:hypothetical protein